MFSCLPTTPSQIRGRQHNCSQNGGILLHWPVLLPVPRAGLIGLPLNWNDYISPLSRSQASPWPFSFTHSGSIHFDLEQKSPPWSKLLVYSGVGIINGVLKLLATDPSGRKFSFSAACGLFFDPDWQLCLLPVLLQMPWRLSQDLSWC
jgi:hypothetical protein